MSGGVCWQGNSGEVFCYDNEQPSHQVFLRDFAIGNDLVTNGEFAEFIADGGYERPSLWLDDGWRLVCTERICAPSYWRGGTDEPRVFTLNGEVALDPRAPVTHVSYYEADAFARWAGARLPTEQEWERAAVTLAAKYGVGAISGTFADDGLYHPVGLLAASLPSVEPKQLEQRPAGESPVQLEQRPAGESPVRHMLGEVWEWTASPYVPYPGFVPYTGPLGEYNGKFMCNQMVLRGGSCATPRRHARITYRNFFQPEKRWQFSGIRLARDD